MLGRVDDRVRGFWRDRADEHMIAGKEAFAKEQLARLGAASPDYSGVARTLADRTGGDVGALEAALGIENQAQIRQRLDDAYAAQPGPLVRGTSILSNTGTKARIGQAGIYGAMGGGVTLGLTAAGQGLMALMDYMNQGQQVASARDQELTS